MRGLKTTRGESIMEHPITTVIFDLDGTLVNTIDDIASSMNKVLSENNYKIHSNEHYRQQIGGGTEGLVANSLPVSAIDNFDKYHERFTHFYDADLMKKTDAFPGVLELLHELRLMNIKISVLSNKIHPSTLRIVNAIFEESTFSSIQGAVPDIPKKPDPTSALKMLKNLSCNPESTIYVGDTVIDIKTAKAANLVPIGVSWGYGQKNELLEAGAEWLIDHPLELIQIVRDTIAINSY